ncbi:hypothetical protein BDY17DRAFT_246987 [Neohortaea acidophila]|uniref:DNA-directed RNA polymerase subunit n=1 Tax=Neohortaea acidophila TaxID=245834 RepID=A0A6A6Q0X7_9PEZI|nr:uncharacterized protein BDY17DRAFT_246987 [Neohortaea acidophila]KAF2485067.1 hypothetical protein BDY17DRAFT_246987 [Neohortaea acidophila]
MSDDEGSKEQVLDQAPKRIKALQFGLLSPQDIISQSVLSISDRNIFDFDTSHSAGQKRGLTQNGPNDPRLGTSSKTALCETCGRGLMQCNGHFGHVRLVLPAFHYGYMKKIMEVLNCICKDCSRILMPEKERRAALKAVRKPGLDTLRRNAICKKFVAECRKVKICPRCSSLNGPVRKVPNHPLKMFHNKFAIYTMSNAKSKVKPIPMLAFEKSFKEASKHSADVDRHMRRAMDDMHPLRVLNIFRKIPSVDVELLGMDPHHGGRPEYMLWTHVPAPPVTIRPSVAQEQASTEDDITNKLGDIIHINNFLQVMLTKGQPLVKVMEIWDIDEVAVPSRVAVVMTYPEKVTQHNLAKLKQCVIRGSRKHPGANFIVKASGRRIVLSTAGQKGNLSTIADALDIGDTVERHLEDGDIVLFNRQPSLHKLSIMSHRVKVRPWRTFRLNECVCNPYNADFDGDEMNLHVPQTEEARTEALELMGVKHNLATPKNGTPIIAAIQDFITGAYLLSQKDRFFTRREFMQIVSFMYDGIEVRDPSTGQKWPVKIPEPAILKPQTLWTGKQIWNVLMKPHPEYPVNVNLEAKAKQFTPPDATRLFDWTEDENGEVISGRKPKGDIAPDMSETDSFLVIRNSEVMCGVLDKATIGDGKKDSVFYIIMRDFGPDYAVVAMNRLAKLCARWLGEQGFSIGIGDVYPSQLLREKKDKLVKEAYDECIRLINDFNAGKLQRDPGCDADATLENKISGLLSRVREACGNVCFAELSRFNAPLTMAKCGSKGSNINVSQMVAAVGQQIISGKRVINGFENRTLPHFAKASRDPPAKGFVVNSFFSGLNPTEFIFHAMSGREGLVDTAVKTAETGYMSRRLMKSLEDLSAQYDLTVRNSMGGVVQMKFGDDGLDPVDMEGNAKPVDFDRTFLHAVHRTWDNEEAGLTAKQIASVVKKRLDVERAKLVRKDSSDGSIRPYDDTSDTGIDQLESAREFLEDIENFVDDRAEKLVASRMRLPGTDAIFKISRSALEEFLHLCLKKFEKSKVEAGHAVGAVGAQSIGEPGTQMTLKTFHFAGVAGMNLTQGVPRIKEIINASKTISTPIITCALNAEHDEIAARHCKAVIEKTYLKDIVAYIEDVWYLTGSYLNMRVDWQRVDALGLDINLYDVTNAIEKTKGMKSLGVSVKPFGNSHIRVVVDPEVSAKLSKARRAKNTKQILDRPPDATFETMQLLKRKLPQVVIQGYPDAARTVLKKADQADASGKEAISVFVEGYGLKACMTTPGINGLKTVTNSVMEMKEVLGIEAARATIINEIREVMKGLSIDPRHMQLLADVMTYKGEVLGITRFGLSKMRDSVLHLASFEKTTDHLFDAAIQNTRDEIRGVSECIIMGQSVGLGTGAMKVFRPLGVEGRPSGWMEGAGLHEAVKKEAKGRRERLVARRGMVGEGGGVRILVVCVVD